MKYQPGESLEEGTLVFILFVTLAENERYLSSPCQQRQLFPVCVNTVFYIFELLVSGELTVTLITIWWWQKLGKDWQ